MALTEIDLAQTEARMQTGRDIGPRAIDVRYDPHANRVAVLLDSQVELSFPPALAEGLAHASPDELAEVHLTPSGLGLHCPRLDADIYVPALTLSAFSLAQEKRRLSEGAVSFMHMPTLSPGIPST